jgi:hypothetical protein
MRILTIMMFAVLLGGCGDENKWAEDAVPPVLNELAETPGDWSRLAGAVGRTPVDSGLLTHSPITVDLNALLGADAEAYRAAMADAGPLVREGGVLVSRSPSGNGYIVIQPAEHAMEIGLRRRGEWRTFHTAGVSVPRPAAVQALLNG